MAPSSRPAGGTARGHGGAATLVGLCCLLAGGSVQAQTPADPPRPAYDADLARAVGADEHGMRRYVLVLLKTGPNRIPPGPERDAMFQGHFANMGRLAADGKLALAGPFDGTDGWRGMYIFAVTDIDEARRLVATDPVVAKGEMVAEFHPYFGSAALMQVNALHARITRP